jgi:autotransporter passenger strand-loop-strand repeat protein
MSGATQYVFATGAASATVVESGGVVFVRSGAVAAGAMVSSGGGLVLSSGGTARALALLSGGKLTDDGTVAISGPGTLAGILLGTGSIVETGGGDLLLSGDGAKFAGHAVISGGTIELGASHALGSGSVTFVEPATGSAVLQIDAADAPAAGGTFADIISNFNGANEEIDLPSLAFVSGASATVVGHDLVLKDGGKSYTFDIAGTVAGAYPVTSDGHGGTLIDPVAAPLAPAGASHALFVQAMASFAAPPALHGGHAASATIAAAALLTAVGSGAAGGAWHGG